MQTALNVAQLFAALVWLVFWVWYIIRAKWWKSAFGWNTLGVSLLLSLIFGRLAVLTYEPEFKADLRVMGMVIYVGAGVLGAHRLWLLERAQRGMHRRVGDFVHRD